MSCFNSIKVRLELKAISAVIGFIAFQFHKGTIRTFDVFMPQRNIHVSIP